MIRRFSVGILFVALILTGCIEEKKQAPSDIAEARQAMLARNYLEAEKNYERYLRRNPQGEDRWEVWNRLVDLALSVRNDRKAAIELLEAMRIDYADDTEKKRSIGGRLAELYRLARNYDRALSLWAMVAEDSGADPVDRAQACRSLAGVYLRRLEFELARESLDYCLALSVPDPVRAECLYDLAQTDAGNGDLDKAVAGFRSVLALKDIPETKRTLTVFMLADALDQKGETAEALKLFTEINESYPNRKVIEQRIDFLRKKKKPGKGAAQDGKRQGS